MIPSPRSSRKLLALAGSVLLLLTSTVAHATQVRGRLVDASGKALAGGQVLFTLVNCGILQGPPTLVAGGALGTVTAGPFKAGPGGEIIAQVAGNDQILCSNTFNTSWNVAVYNGPITGTPVWQKTAILTGGTWNLETGPYTQVLPSLVQPNAVVTNPNSDQIITVPTGRKFEIDGTVIIPDLEVEVTGAVGAFDHTPTGCPTTSTFATAIDSRGNLTCTGVNWGSLVGAPTSVSALGGQLAANQMPGLSGDIANTAGPANLTVTGLHGLPINPGAAVGTGMAYVFDGHYFSPQIPNDAQAIHTGTNSQQSLAGPLLLNDGSLAASQSWTTQYVNTSTETVSNALAFPGGDLSAKIAAAQTACSAHCHIFVPAGTYTVSTTLNMQSPGTNVGYTHLEFDSGATINYTGTGNFIQSPFMGGDNQPFTEISGGQINCINHTGTNGVELQWSNFVEVHHMLIHGCQTGVYVHGTNSGSIHNMRLEGNGGGIYMDASNGTPNAFHIFDNEIGLNTIGFSVNGCGGGTGADNTDVYDNVFEGNTGNDVRDVCTYGSVYRNNYFESPGSPALFLGYGNYSIDSIVENNYFTVGNGTFSSIHLFGLGSHVSGNVELLQNAQGVSGFPTCFIDTAFFGEHTYIGSNFTTKDNSPNSTESELCFNGTPTTALAQGWANSISVGETVHGNLSADGSISTGSSITAGTVTSNGYFKLAGNTTSFPTTATIVGQIGPLLIWEASFDPGGACGNVDIWFSPSGLSYCQNGTWFKK